MAALGGDVRAQMVMGHYYWAGVTTQASCEKVLDFYRKVANKVAEEVSLNGGPVVQRVRLLDEHENSNYSSGIFDQDLIEYYQLLATYIQVPLRAKYIPMAHVSSMLHGSPSKGSDTYQNTLDETSRTGPYFDKSASKNVTALLGKTTYLNCRVKNLGNKTVSWVRHRDIHLLTIGRYTYTNDQRFRAIHQSHSDDWVLQIKYPQHRDTGIYECQVSTIPHMSHFVHLNVVEPVTEILGGPDLYIDRGSTINLTCIILHSPEPPAYIFWNHNDVIISYDSVRGGVSVVTEKGDSTTSFLLVQKAKPSDSGRYTCNPSNAQPKSITVHVLNGEYPAAMQHGGQAHQPRLYSLLLCLCLLLY